MLRNHIEIITVLIAAVLCLILREPAAVCIVLALCIAALLAERVFSRMLLRRRIKKLTDYISAVQDDLTLPDMDSAKEGELGILHSEIYKVVALLREQYSTEKKQKQYMADMLADISHQLKTPLTAIQLMTELLEAPELSTENRLEYAEKIDSQLSRINWLIRSLLTLSQLEAGVLKMKEEKVLLTDITDTLTDSLGIMAELRGVSLETDAPEGAAVTGDRHWLTEAVMNIVKNCIEHTSEGGWVRLRAESNNMVTRIFISDNGSGIDSKDLPYIFDRFYKAENASVQSVGIGLALARQIICSHDGSVEVKSEKGKGTEFTVSLYRMG